MPLTTWYTFKAHSIAILNRVKDEIEVFSVHKESFLIILLLPRILSNSAGIFSVTVDTSLSASVIFSFFRYLYKHPS